MKKLLMGSAALTLFSIALILFQISCKKEATAQSGGTSYTLPPATTSSLGGIIVGNGLNITPNGTLSTSITATQANKILYSKDLIGSAPELWTANFDGTNQSKVNILLPTNVRIGGRASLSPDKQKIFFETFYVNNSPNGNGSIYSCNVDGSNVSLVIPENNGASIGLNAVY